MNFSAERKAERELRHQGSSSEGDVKNHCGDDGIEGTYDDKLHWFWAVGIIQEGVTMSQG